MPNAYVVIGLVAFTILLKLRANVAGSAILAIAWPALLVALFLLFIKVRVLRLPIKNDFAEVSLALLVGCAAMGFAFWYFGYFSVRIERPREHKTQYYECDAIKPNTQRQAEIGARGRWERVEESHGRTWRA